MGLGKAESEANGVSKWGANGVGPHHSFSLRLNNTWNDEMLIWL